MSDAASPTTGAQPGTDLCHVGLIHADESTAPCVLPRTHLDYDSDHQDEHGCRAAVLIHRSTIDEVARVNESCRARAERPQMTVKVLPGAAPDQPAGDAALSILRCCADPALTVTRSLAPNSQIISCEHCLTGLLQLSWRPHR
jgi:hypothetical protein